MSLHHSQVINVLINIWLTYLIWAPIHLNQLFLTARFKLPFLPWLDDLECVSRQPSQSPFQHHLRTLDKQTQILLPIHSYNKLTIISILLISWNDNLLNGGKLAHQLFQLTDRCIIRNIHQIHPSVHHMGFLSWFIVLFFEIGTHLAN